MKKSILLLAFIIGFVTFAGAQGTIVKPGEFGPDSLQGDLTTLTVYSPLLDEYWDYSLQLKSTFAGLGDSTNFSVTTWQTNDPDQSVWTEITALRDTLATVTDESGLLIEKSDFQGIWMKHIITSQSLDTMLIEGFWVKKQKRNRFF